MCLILKMEGLKGIKKSLPLLHMVQTKKRWVKTLSQSLNVSRTWLSLSFATKLSVALKDKKKWGRGCRMVLGLSSFSSISWLKLGNCFYDF